MVTQLRIQCNNKKDHWLYHDQGVICPCVPWIEKIQGHYIAIRFIPECVESLGHRIYGAIGEACPCITGQARYLYDKKHNDYQLLAFSPQSPKDPKLRIPLLKDMLNNGDHLVVEEIPEEVGKVMVEITSVSRAHLRSPQHETIDWDKYYDIWFEYKKKHLDKEKIC